MTASYNAGLGCRGYQRYVERTESDRRTLLQISVRLGLRHSRALLPCRWGPRCLAADTGPRPRSSSTLAEGAEASRHDPRSQYQDRSVPLVSMSELVCTLSILRHFLATQSCCLPRKMTRRQAPPQRHLVISLPPDPLLHTASYRSVPQRLVVLHRHR